jgi:hypothetical protein
MIEKLIKIYILNLLNIDVFSLLYMLDGRCLGSFVRSVFDGIIRNTFGHYLAGLIQGSSDILFAELSAIYKGLLLTKIMNIDELVCYSNFLHCINLIKSPKVRYHTHVVLI